METPDGTLKVAEGVAVHVDRPDGECVRLSIYIGGDLWDHVRENRDSWPGFWSTVALTDDQAAWVAHHLTAAPPVG